MSSRAFITGLAGTVLTEDERTFLREAAPWGFILFKRNIDNPAQVAALVSELRAVVGWQAPVLIDQEGGRVQRLAAPHWPLYPPGRVYAALYEKTPPAGLSAAWLGARLIADDLMALGIDVDCLPLADVPVAGADAIIGDRAYGTHPAQVAGLAQAVAAGLHAGGVLPVLKHIPGHGRANADSHLALPVVDVPHGVLQATDFAPFRALRGLPLAMTAHVVFSALDPAQPATTSATMVGQVIRHEIGFQGLLMSDDVSMKALSGTIGARSAAAIAAGCDVVLHCNGDLDEMGEVAGHVPALAGIALERAERALAERGQVQPFERGAAEAEFLALVAQAGWGRDGALIG